ncbi:MAG: glycosyltransferase family 4 protein [Anaerolineaceae bacterium]|nr:glycosyltransferase family 4 protein [Anaerolineaceae bacterium]
MKIVMFSINPLFHNKVTGGASKHLYHIARHLGNMGHQVEIVCAQSVDPQEPFTWSEHVHVYPVLPFHLPFPQPYAVSGPDLVRIIEILTDFLVDADRFYIHDGELLIPDVYQHIPTVVSLRDNIYPESVLGSFIGRYDELICVSPYSASVVRGTVGRFYPELDLRLHQVNNGIDFEMFHPVDATKLATELGVNPNEQVILLHPHRPEPGKGLPETIRVVETLVHRFGIHNLKVLIPEWIGSMVSQGEATFYGEMIQLMVDLDVRDHFVFVPWIPAARMPELYSLGQVTLCLGNIVEAFGNVAYESLACGTPSVVSRTGVHRTLLPDELIDKVDYGDIQAAAGKIVEIIQSGGQVEAETTTFIQTYLDFDRQVEQYAQIITTAEKREPMPFSKYRPNASTPYQLAPWCYLDHDRIYHDFRGQFEPAEDIAEVFKGMEWISAAYAEMKGFSEAQWQDWIDKTYLIPVINRWRGI